MHSTHRRYVCQGMSITPRLVRRHQTNLRWSQFRRVNLVYGVPEYLDVFAPAIYGKSGFLLEMTNEL